MAGHDFRINTKLLILKIRCRIDRYNMLKDVRDIFIHFVKCTLVILLLNSIFDCFIYLLHTQ